MEKCRKASQSTDGSIKRHMRLLCWITKATDTFRIRTRRPCLFSIVCFGLRQQNALNDRRYADDKGACSSLVGIPLCLRKLERSPLGTIHQLFSSRFQNNTASLFIYESIDYTKLLCAMTQAFSRRPHSAEALVRPQASQCEMCVRQSGTETGFCLRALRFSFLTSVHQRSIHLPPTLYNPRSWLRKTLPHQ